MRKKKVSKHRSVPSPRGVSEDILELLKNAGKKMNKQLAAAGTPPAGGFFSGNYGKNSSLGIFTTGIPFFDILLCGGHAPGEVYGLLGPYGSGKTMLATMLCVEACCQANAVLQVTGEHEYVFIVSYETPLNELCLRAIAYCAKIDRQSFYTTDQVNPLPTGERLSDYEKAISYHAILNGKNYCCERERHKAAVAVLGKHLMAIDMTGTDSDRRNVGHGYVPEITTAINAKLKTLGPKAKVRMVAVDYVGAMVDQFMEATEKNGSELGHLIEDAPLLVKDQIASQFSCPVWLFHQLSGAANGGGLTANRDHRNAAGCETFGKNLDFAFVIGPQDTSGICTLRVTKYKRTSDREKQIIQINGKMSAIVGVNAIYMTDSSR